jgi:hypothetical protein
MPMNINENQDSSQPAQPIRYPRGQDGGPWGVCSIGMSWWIIHSETLEAQRVGLIGKPAIFASALTEAARRNIEGDV